MELESSINDLNMQHVFVAFYTNTLNEAAQPIIGLLSELLVTWGVLNEQPKKKSTIACRIEPKSTACKK